jgi:hypothetical protein
MTARKQDGTKLSWHEGIKGPAKAHNLQDMLIFTLMCVKWFIWTNMLSFKEHTYVSKSGC